MSIYIYIFIMHLHESPQQMISCQLWFLNVMNSEALGFQYPTTCRNSWRPSLLGHTKSSPVHPLVNHHVFQMAMITIWDQPMLRQNHIKYRESEKLSWIISLSLIIHLVDHIPTLSPLEVAPVCITTPTPPILQHRRRAHRRVPPPSHSLPRGAEAQVFADLCKVLTLR